LLTVHDTLQSSGLLTLNIYKPFSGTTIPKVAPEQVKIVLKFRNNKIYKYINKYFAREFAPTENHKDANEKTASETWLREFLTCIGNECEWSLNCSKCFIRAEKVCSNQWIGGRLICRACRCAAAVDTLSTAETRSILFSAQGTIYVPSYMER
jgi:hypothetical protein